MNVKELKEIVDFNSNFNSNDKVNKAFDKLYSIIADRAKDGYTSYTTSRQQLRLTESEFLKVIARLSNDGYSVYRSEAPVRYLDVVDSEAEGLDCFCALIATVILKLTRTKSSQIKIVWKFEEE